MDNMIIYHDTSVKKSVGLVHDRNRYIDNIMDKIVKFY